MSEMVLLKWNDHKTNMMDACKEFLLTEEMADVTLACEGRRLKAHKFVLSASSTFFRSLLSENPCKHPIVILNDVKYSELKAITQFMYDGELNIAQDQLSALLKVADTLRVKGLMLPTDVYAPGNVGEFSDKTEPKRNELSKRISTGSRKQSVNGNNICNENTSNLRINKPYSSEIYELPRKKKTQTMHYSPISSLKSTHDVSCCSINSSHKSDQQQEENKTGIVVGENFSYDGNTQVNLSVAPEKTQNEYNLQRGTGTPFVQSSIASVENQCRWDSYKLNYEAFPFSSTPSDASLFHCQEQNSSPSMESGITELPVSIPDSGGHLCQRNQNSTALTVTSLQDNSPLPFTQSISQNVELKAETTITDASDFLSHSPRNKEKKDSSRSKVLQCSNSKYTTPYASLFKSRNKIHTGERPYACKDCGYTFKTKSNLKRHMVVHSGIKRYACSDCDKKFFHKADLGRHKTIHTGEKPYLCNFCDSTFNQKSNLKTHMRVHTGVKPFACSVCPYNSTSKRNLKKHILALHPKEQWER